MSLLLSKILIGIIMSISSFFICKSLLGYNKKTNVLEIIFSILVISSPTVVFYELNYNGLITLFTFILSMIIYRNLFKENITTAFLLISFVMVLTAIADLGWTTVIKNFIDVKEMRENWLIMLVSNVAVGGISVLLSNLKLCKFLFKGLIKKLSKKVYLSTILFIILFIGVIILLHLNMSVIFKNNEAYVIALTSFISFFILYYIYMIEKVNYDKLSDEYDSLFECIQTFENWIDTEQLNMHEMKNNLSIISGMTEDQKIIKKINEMLQESMIIERDWVEQLKYIPKGGIKGLLYYKMAIAKSKKVNLYVEVSPKVKEKLENLEDETVKKLCILLGIYLDNAIEAAEGTEKSQVSVEVYLCNESLNFVISNSYKERPDLYKMNEKGVSTKGKGRGRGLYFAKKTLNKNKEFIGTQQILNEFYIQKLVVNITNKKRF